MSDNRDPLEKAVDQAAYSNLRGVCRKQQDEIARLTARVEELEGALRDLVRLVDEDQEEDVPPYLADQVLDRARAAITKGESRD